MYCLAELIVEYCTKYDFNLKDLNLPNTRTPNAPSYLHTPLTFALQQQNPTLTLALLQTGVDPELANLCTPSLSPLAYLAGFYPGEETAIEFIKLMLENTKININSQNNEFGYTALMWSVAHKRQMVAKFLLTLNADRNLTVNRHPEHIKLSADSTAQNIASYLRLDSLVSILTPAPAGVTPSRAHRYKAMHS